MIGTDNRIQIERDFHNRRAVNTASRDSYWGGFLFKADRYAYSLLGSTVEGKVILDLGCGTGHHAINFAEKGAMVYAIDLSPGMVQAARMAIAAKGLHDRVQVLTMNAEELLFPDEAFDFVFGHSILHHTDLKLTRAQVYRVLKRGGKGVFLEPLNHNPFINLFRKLTPSRRTPTEKPLRMQDLFFFAEPFSAFDHREFYMVALIALIFLPLSKQAFQKTLDFLSIIDDNLLSRWPALSRYAWVTVFEVVK